MLAPLADKFALDPEQIVLVAVVILMVKPVPIVTLTVFVFEHPKALPVTV